jgi:transposase-like protein
MTRTLQGRDPMMYLIEKVVIFPGPEAVRLAGPAELDLTLTDQAKFVICNHTIEQDHRGVKRVTRPMLGFKSFQAAQGTIAGVELMHMLKKRQRIIEAGEENLTAAEQFYALAA